MFFCVLAFVAVMLSRTKAKWEKDSTVRNERRATMKMKRKKYERKAFQALILMNSFICGIQTHCHLYKSQGLRFNFARRFAFAHANSSRSTAEIFIFTNKITAHNTITGFEGFIRCRINMNLSNLRECRLNKSNGNASGLNKWTRFLCDCIANANAVIQFDFINFSLNVCVCVHDSLALYERGLKDQQKIILFCLNTYNVPFMSETNGQ